MQIHAISVWFQKNQSKIKWSLWYTLITVRILSKFILGGQVCQKHMEFSEDKDDSNFASLQENNSSETLKVVIELITLEDTWK